jgi:alpha-ribazole phosphatase
MQIYLVRHTKPQVDAGVCYGQTDLALADSFEQELVTVKSKLSHLESAKVFSSPLSRCQQLARQFSSFGEISYDDRLMELNFGDWEMKSWDEIPNGLIDEWVENHVMIAPPNGESFNELSLRCQSFWKEISASTEHESVVIFTHAGAIRALLCHVLDLPLQNGFRLHVDYGGVSQVSLHSSIPNLIFHNR